MGQKLTLLLPVRNSADTLASWLSAAEDVADAVIALDDGSTDATSDVLHACDIVTTVLTNPVRETYLGWNDRDNRQRLIYAALSGTPSWLMFLDADERIDPTDASALRSFIDEDAIGGFAYGFEVFRMEGDGDYFDPRAYWVFRLFSSRDATSPLPEQSLHFVPVPTGLPRTRWLQTSIRIQHFGSASEELRQQRFAKYAEVDPTDEFEQSYASLLDGPQTVLPWTGRSPDLPVVLGTRGRYADLVDSEPLGLDIAVTAVVIARDDIDVIDRSIEALVSQNVDEPFEVILVGSGSDGTVDHIRSMYPSVRCVQLPERVLPGGARNVGLWMARGGVVTFPGSHVWLAEGALQARLAAHDEGWDMVTCAVLNGNKTRAGWASYFLDHSAQIPTRVSGAFSGAPGHASYFTEDVLKVGGFPEDMRAGEDTVVNQRLYNEGKRTYFSSESAFYHASPSTTFRQLAEHHLRRGEALGRIIGAGSDRRASLGTLGRSAQLPIRRLRAVREGMMYATPELKQVYNSVWPLVLGGAVTSGAGTMRQLTTGRERKPRHDESVIGREWRWNRGLPILGIGGRPGPGATGLLSYGTADQAARRLMTFARLAEFQVEAVAGVLVPIVTSATVTAEEKGTFTTLLSEEIVNAYIDAARSVGAGVMLQIQPGNAKLRTAFVDWQDLLAEPDVGLMLDLRSHVAFGGQMEELDAFRDWYRDRRSGRGHSESLLVASDGGLNRLDMAEPVFISLSDPGGKLPHEAFADHSDASALIYV